jgi:hypothetical protein
MQDQAIADSTQRLVIVVPRAEAALQQSLRHAFDHDATVEVTVDRRVAERRTVSDTRTVERRRGERRRTPGADSALRAGRWIVVPPPSGAVDIAEARTRALLFLCCGNHLVPCERCQDTYRLGWVRRVEPQGFACPLCANDLSATVAAHAEGCRSIGGAMARSPRASSPPE